MKTSFVLFISFVVLLGLAGLCWAAPAPPVMTHSTNGLNVTVNWSQVADATGYTLYYAPYPYTGADSIGSLDVGTDTSFSIDLWDGAAYYVAVSANNESGSSGYSNIELFFIYAEGNAPKGMLSYSDTPTQGQEVTLSFEVDKGLHETTWKITSKPSNSNMTLAVSADLKTATFTPDQIGDYEITVRSKPDGFEQATNFTIRPTFAYDEAEIVGNDGETPLSEIIGVIKNQSWVYAPSLSEAELISIVSQYDEFEIVGYDEIQGLLIEYDEEAVKLTGSLEALKQESLISSVVNRVYEGEDSRSTGAIPPNDGSSFYDGGDNWHLEFTDVVSAWDITTGNSDISVGVTDAGYDVSHYELSGRVSTLLSSKTHDHGNGVAGTIGALTDNGSGMSGVNWTSQLLLGDWTPDHIISILKNSKSRLSNQSWTFTYANSSFDPNDQLSASQRKADMVSLTRSYRKVILNYPDKIMVWAAGNGLGNGAGHNGIYGIDGNYAMPALHLDDNGNLDKLNNLITVAAMADESHLTYYSNYGESVDIAAPSHFKSLITNQGFQNFTGTSAASPVVTGVTSLIYSLYPDFTGKEVKDILISSATDYVYERYVSPSNKDTEQLTHPLPILNAGNALAMAEEKVFSDKDGDGYNLSQGDCDDNDSSRHPEAEEVIDYIDNNCDGRIDEVTTLKLWYRDLDGDLYGDIATSQYAFYRPDGYVLNNTDCNDNNASIHPGVEEIADDGIDQDCNGEDAVTTLTMSGTVHSGSTTGPALSGATVSIAGKTATSSSTGAFSISGIPAGTYSLSVSKSGYDTYTNPSYYVGSNQSGLDFYITSSLPSYTMSGTVHSGSATGPALAGAIVSINGQTATSSSTGAFSISGIPAGTYSLSVSKSGYDTYTNPSYYVGSNQNGLDFWVTTSSAAVFSEADLIGRRANADFGFIASDYQDGAYEEIHFLIENNFTYYVDKGGEWYYDGGTGSWFVNQNGELVVSFSEAVKCWQTDLPMNKIVIKLLAWEQGTGDPLDDWAVKNDHADVLVGYYFNSTLLNPEGYTRVTWVFDDQ